jgi:cysteinyl-tRNA synthetase
VALGEFAGMNGTVSVLGIDPGLQLTGYAVVEARVSAPFVCEAGVIRSAENRAKPDIAVRLSAIHRGFDTSGSNPDFLAEVARLRDTFLDHMDDDFNTGGAVGVLYELLTSLNRFADAKRLEEQPRSDDLAALERGVLVLKELSQILGVFEQPPTKTRDAGEDELIAGLMQLLIDMRAEARKAKNFALADQIRKRLGEIGITLEDRAGGTGWRVG